MKKFTVILIAIVFSVIAMFSITACDSDELSAKIDKMQSTINQLQEDLEKSNSNSSSLNSSIDELQSALDKLQEELNKSNADADDLKSQISQLEAQLTALQDGKSTAEKSYDKIKYIDANLSDRDCYHGENFKETQQWIKELALDAGYDENVITTQDVTTTTYAEKDSLDTALSAVKSYTTDGKFYSKSGRKYVEDPEGSYVKASVVTENIIITKAGKSDKQIIVGAHYDGDGTGDNGSGIALAITTAEKLVNVKTPYTIKFVFFTAEEYGCYGSTAYANAMSDEEVENTLYMINLDSLVCGDYCYIYGGVQDDDNKIVTQTEAYDNAMAIAQSLGLDFHSNPWTWENPAPGYDTPDYASPSTGDWSDHKGFKNRGIKYLYMEATNWEIPGPYNEYDGYGETVLVGMLMNTANDYLEYIETYFPGRIQEHLYQFATLLNALLVQPKVNF